MKKKTIRSLVFRYLPNLFSGIELEQAS